MSSKSVDLHKTLSIYRPKVGYMCVRTSFRSLNSGGRGRVVYGLVVSRQPIHRSP